MQSKKSVGRSDTSPKSSASTSAPELPEWVKETPEPTEPWPPFSMISQNMEGEFLQDIALTREEYLALKSVLAKMRGYVSA